MRLSCPVKKTKSNLFSFRFFINSFDGSIISRSKLPTVAASEGKKIKGLQSSVNLLLFYKNINGFESVAHSAGRHLNSNEAISSKYSESNFYAIINKEFTPIVHIFSGKNINRKKNFIDIKI